MKLIFESYRRQYLLARLSSMAFLSGLKVAYDSLGSEISRTFSSSNEDPLVQSREVEPGASRGDTEEGIKATDPEGFNEVNVPL